MIIDLIYYLSLILIAIFVLSLCVFLASCVLPRILLRPGKTNAEQRSRGIKKIAYENGRAIVYEPSLKVKKYFKQYILSENSGDKFIKCKLDDRVTSTRYTVVAIDSRDKLIDIVDVEEKIADTGYTKAVILPRNTSYVNLIVREVNGIVVPDRDKIILSGLGRTIYIACVSVMTAMLSILVSTATVSIISQLSKHSTVIQRPNAVISLLIGAVIGALYALTVCGLHNSKESKVEFEKSKEHKSRKTGRKK